MPRLARAAVVVLFAAQVLTACGGASDVQAVRVSAKPTEPSRATVSVRRATIAETIRGVGRVTAANETPLFFRSSGRVRVVNVQPSQTVKRGDVLAEIDGLSLQTQLQIARANTEIGELRAAMTAEAGGDRSVRDLHAALDRALASDPNSAATKQARSQYEARIVELKVKGGKLAESGVAEKNLEIARLTQKLLEQQVEDTVIRAEFDGVIAEMGIRNGDQVQPFAAVGILADPSRFQVRVDMPPVDVAKIRMGQAATVTIETLGGMALTETVVDVPPVSAVRGAGESLQVKLSLGDAARGVLLGVPANVAITTQQKDGVLVVPSTAVKRFGGRRIVQVVGTDGRRRDVEVDVGLVNETETEIVDGLTEGQSVVAS